MQTAMLWYTVQFYPSSGSYGVYRSQFIPFVSASYSDGYPVSLDENTWYFSLTESQSYTLGE